MKPKAKAILMTVVILMWVAVLVLCIIEFPIVVLVLLGIVLTLVIGWIIWAAYTGLEHHYEMKELIKKQKQRRSEKE